MARSGGLFNGHTAWFSDSVNREYIQLWYRHGGWVEDVDSPAFLFSQDPSAEDTKTVYESPQYMKDSLAVIHPMYIECCVQARSMEAITLGQFFLPPQDIYNAIKHNHQFRWEMIERRTTPKKAIGKQIWKSASKSKKSQESSEVTKAANPAKRDLARSLSSEADEHDSEQPRSPKRSHTKRRPKKAPEPAPVVEDYSDYLRVEDLPKVSAELFDFKAGRNGCTVEWATAR